MLAIFKKFFEFSIADSVNIQKKKKLKQELEREIEKDMQNIRAARALAPQAVGRPSIYLHINDVIQSAPKFQSSNGRSKPVKRKIGKTKRPVRKKQKRLEKIRDEKPKGASPLLKFGFRPNG